MRYFFESPTIWAWEFNMQLWAALVLMAGAYCLLENQHVRVDVVYNVFSPKKKAILDIVTYLIIILCMLIVMKYGYKLGIDSLIRGEKQATIWESPMWTIRMWIPIGATLMLLQAISEGMKAMFTIKDIEFESIVQKRKRLVREGE